MTRSNNVTSCQAHGNFALQSLFLVWVFVPYVGCTDHPVQLSHILLEKLCILEECHDGGYPSLDYQRDHLSSGGVLPLAFFPCCHLKITNTAVKCFIVLTWSCKWKFSHRDVVNMASCFLERASSTIFHCTVTLHTV